MFVQSEIAGVAFYFQNEIFLDHDFSLYTSPPNTKTSPFGDLFVAHNATIVG